ncbi:hypothetical protein E1212_07755 [Jiangella ureilytica]|uniref:Uncharacterized protein n=1 Tax=Jiangella ureilytica TaxID=2530374 RepID=A0A4R4RTU7_9ACTN|nr:hypothetical protein [Jiangella ureilytica]TDC52739.1 hypothetical protein E1212_07755 [Jiangella ureilytica]
MSTPHPPEPSVSPEPATPPSRVRGRVIAGVVAVVAFAAGIAIGAVTQSEDEPEQPVAASTGTEDDGGSETAALEEQVAALQSRVDELTSERDGLQASVTELEAAAAAAAEAAAQATATQAATPAATQAPSPPATEETTPPGGEGTYTAGQFRFADVQVSDDGIGGFALRARVTNNGQAVAGALWTATLFLDGVVVATLNGSAQGFAAGATVTADFWSDDPFGDYDTVEFQVDGQF